MSRVMLGLLILTATVTAAAQGGVPASSLAADAHASLEKRCGVPKAASPASIAALRRSRWVPFLHLDQVIASQGIEVVGGMTAATPGCVAESFNLFVFVDGVFAGAVSRGAMSPSRDGAAGAVRIIGTDTLSVEFARYLPGDAECCPSSRERALYRIEKTGVGPALVAAGTRQVR
jgi:hypothetical protein